MHQREVIDLTGMVFGMLTVLAETRKTSGKRKNVRAWLCRCSCGRESTALTGALRFGRTNSCGCTQFKHGHAGGRERGHSPTYTSWSCMIVRCENPKHPDYQMYGGSGIKVCDRWRNSFADFLADMGERPPGKTIDRKENTKGYEPGNCRWATSRQQAIHRSATLLTESNVQEVWGRFEYGERASSIARRFKVSRWTIGDIITGRTWIGSSAGHRGAE